MHVSSLPLLFFLFFLHLSPLIHAHSHLYYRRRAAAKAAPWSLADAEAGPEEYEVLYVRNMKDNAPKVNGNVKKNTLRCTKRGLCSGTIETR